MALNQRMLDKVRKILAKAQNNPSVEEAETALLIAQRIMAEYGIASSDVRLDTEPVYKEVVDTSVTARVKTVWWQKALAKVIADNFRCEAYTRSGRDGKAQICFIGLKEDVELAKEVLASVIQLVRYHSGRYVKQVQHSYHTPTEVRNSWIQGFIYGLDSKFKEQVTQNDWGLILVKDPAVTTAIEQKELKAGRKTSITSGSRDAYANGYREGHSFVPRAGALHS